jgi:hypothetical protein
MLRDRRWLSLSLLGYHTLSLGPINFQFFFEFDSGGGVYAVLRPHTPYIGSNFVWI